MTEEESEPLDIKFQKRFSRNLISNIAYFFINLIIGLAIVPFFLDTLGPSAYGLIPLATSITSYVTLVINAVNFSVSRYLTVNLQKGNKDNANQTFNTALFGTLGVILLLIPVAFIVAWFAPSFFNIGDQSAFDVTLLFALIFGSVLIRAWSSNFMATLFSNNRIDLRNWINITNIVAQVFFIVFLFGVFSPSLISVGLSYFIAAVVSLILSIFFSKKICPYLYIRSSCFSPHHFYEMGILSFWTCVNMIGGLLISQTALIIVNKFYGDIAGTHYYLALMWPGLIFGIATLITTVFTPMIYSYYSKNDITGLIQFTTITTRLIGIIMALPIGLVFIFIPWLFTFWVGSEYIFLTPLVWILLLPVIIQCQTSCINTIPTAFLRAKIQALGVVSTGVLNIVLALILTNLGNMGINGIAIANVISLFILCGLVDPLYAAHIVKVPYNTFIKPRWIGLFCLLFLILGGLIVTKFVVIEAIWQLIMYGGLIAILYLSVVLKKIISIKEKTLIRSCLPEKIQNIITRWIM